MLKLTIPSFISVSIFIFNSFAAFSHFSIPSSVVKDSEYKVDTISDDIHKLFYHKFY